MTRELPFESTMQDFPLTIRMLFEHGRRVHGKSRVLTFEGKGCREATYEEVAARAARLAGALRRLGVRPGDRVGTFCWNEQEHLEAYFAVPGMGAVLHTLNIRLSPEQLAYVVNHAEDRVILVDASLVPLLARVRASLETVKHVVVIGEGDASALGACSRYEDLLADEPEAFEWPDLDERSAAAMAYTTGTTGEPKGVVYSHRSIVLHAYGSAVGSALATTDRDRVLPIVPMFHAMAWGLPFSAWMAGADFLMPGRFLQAAPLARLIAEERPTLAAAVPTIWSEVLRHAESSPFDMSSLRYVVCGGSAVPRSLIERFEERHGVRIVQGWGMTETSPVAAIAEPPKHVSRASKERSMDYRARTGRVLAGVELRIVDDAGRTLPWDDESVGEIEVRGPWVTASYYRDPSPEKFRDGWLRTGDVGRVSADGFVQITDRAKDVIKSGGEWISSVEVENALMGHPDVAEAAVVGVADERWDERPLACVVRAAGSSIEPSALRDFLAERLPRFWVPERYAFVDAVPKTSVGKFDKKVLRARFAEGALSIVTLERPAR